MPNLCIFAGNGAEFGTDHNDIPLLGYSKEAMARIPACKAEGVEKFAETWVERGWYKSTSFVESIADDADAISEETGCPTARPRAAETTAKKNAWRLVSFIYLDQKFLDKDIKEEEWAGSPAVPEKLLASAQAALVANKMPDWVCPLAPPLVQVLLRVQALAKRAENVLDEGIDASDVIQQKAESLHSEKASIKRAARVLSAGNWKFLCSAALQNEFDELMDDIDSTRSEH